MSDIRVCVREREGRGERERGGILWAFKGKYMGTSGEYRN
jgi:hypothetical protein